MKNHPNLSHAIKASQQDNIAPAGTARAAIEHIKMYTIANAYQAELPPIGLASRTIANLTQEATYAFPNKSFTLRAVCAMTACFAALSLLIPAAHFNRNHSREMACANNLKNIGQANYQYSSQNQDRLPENMTYLASSAVLADELLDLQGESDVFIFSTNQSNGQYLSNKDMICPSDKIADPTWSYNQNLATAGQIISSINNRPLASDRNPRFTRIHHEIIHVSTFQDTKYDITGSESHDYAGMNILQGDGSVKWLASPILDGDNIWTSSDASSEENDNYMVPFIFNPQG